MATEKHVLTLLLDKRFISLSTFLKITNLGSPFKALINIIDSGFKFAFFNKNEVFGWEIGEIYIALSLHFNSADMDDFNER